MVPHITIPSFVSYLGPFSSAYLLPQIPNLSLFYTTASSLGLFARTVHALRHLISFGKFTMTLLRGQIVPLLACAPCLRVFFAFILTMWTLEKAQWIRSWRGLLNALQTFSLCVSPCLTTAL